MNEELKRLSSSEDTAGVLAMYYQLKDGLVATPNAATLTTLVRHFGKNGSIALMEDAADLMLKSGIALSLSAYSAMVEGYGSAGQLSKAMALFEHMKSQPNAPRHLIVRAMIGALACAGDVQVAIDFYNTEVVHIEMESADNEYLSLSTLIAAFADAGHPKEATVLMQHCFDHRLPVKLYSGNVIINHMVKAKNVPEALSVYDSMVAHGLYPITLTMNLLMNAMLDSEADLAGPSLALRVYEELTSRFSLKSDPQTYVLLVRIFAMLGDFRNLLKVFDRMRKAAMAVNYQLYHNTLSMCHATEDSQGLDMFLTRMNQDGIVWDVPLCKLLFRLHLNSGLLRRAVTLLAQMDKLRLMPVASMIRDLFLALSQHQDLLISATASAFLHDYSARLLMDARDVPCVVPSSVLPSPSSTTLAATTWQPQPRAVSPSSHRQQQLHAANSENAAAESEPPLSESDLKHIYRVLYEVSGYL